MRAVWKQKRASLSAEKKQALDSAIVKEIARSRQFRQASGILLYAPMTGEIDLSPLVRIARKLGKRVAFPRCDTESETMRFYELSPNARLCVGAYGIFEPPADAPLYTPDKRTLCILPALTCDPHGNRLGYGKGYYDKFLKTFEGVTLCALYHGFLARELPCEAHDVPVQYLCTERGVFKLRKKKEEAPKKTVSLLASALHAPPTLVACVFCLLLLSRLVEPYFARGGESTGVILLQLLIFAIPAVLYCKLRGESFAERIRMRAPRPGQIWFLLCLLVVMITGGLLLCILTGGIDSLRGSFTLYSVFTSHVEGSVWDVLAVVLAYAVLPAFGEELVFRSILCAEYEGRGVGISVTVSAALFAMLHFSLPLFPAYLLLGLLLAGALYVTRSFLTVFLLHLCYNVFCLFGQPYLSAFYLNAGSNEIFTFCLVVLFLLFAAFAAGEARKIYHGYAKRNLDSSYTVSVPLKEYPKALLRSCCSPAVALCMVLWLVFSLLNLF